MSRAARLISSLALLVLVLPAAQIASAASSQGKDTSSYLLGPDDVIEVNVRNHPDLNRMITVQPDGRINFPEVGEVDASGKTPKELADSIGSSLEKYRRNAGVVVTLKEVHSRRVRLIGAVKIAGVYDLKRNWRLLDVVAVGGGFSAKPTRIAGRVIRGDAKVIPLDVARAVADPDSDANLPLEKDDLVLLEELDPIRNQASVLGQVMRPGPFEIDPETTVISLLAGAGGPTNTAALTRAYIARGTKQFPMNLRPVVIEGKTDNAIAKFKIEPGDVLFIPEIEPRYIVAGLVQRPGYYPLPEDGQLTVLKALYSAGGAAAGSDEKHAMLLHTVDGNTTATPVDIDAMLKKANLAANVPMEPGDVLFVPARSGHHGPTLQDALTPFSVLSFLGLRLFH